MSARWGYIPMPKVLPATTKAEVDRRIELWHTSPDDSVELHEFLGWTEEQYARWLERGIIPW